MAKPTKIGLIGAGFIGSCHARAIHMMQTAFPDAPLRPEAHMIVENTEEVARRQAERLGFVHATTDWQRAIDTCDAIVIAVPSYLHREIALAAFAEGVPVLCEKPVGLSASEAAELAAASKEKSVSNAVGFTYLRTPLVRHAVELVRSGSFGQPLHFRGWHCEDYFADPAAPFSWRLDPKLAGRCGALGDLGWHILSIARALCGSVTALSGSVRTFHTRRPLPDNPSLPRDVGNEDWAGMTLEFESGAVGVVETSRVALGRKMDIGFELVCEGGTITFQGERMNELRLYQPSVDAANQGFKLIHASSQHPDYEAFIAAPGHGLGFNDLKTIELRDFVQAIAEGRNAVPDLDQAAKIAGICEAVLESSAAKCWISSPEAGRN